MARIFTASALGPRRRLLLLLVVLGFAGLAGIFMLRGPNGPALEGIPKGFVLSDVPQAVPDVRFSDGVGRPRALADFRGKVVLLNIWATWCLPCREEMPTLDRLQAALGGDRFEVVALSIDRGGVDAVKKFYAEIDIQHLAIHVDTSSQVGFAVATAGLPTTLLIDAEGRELGRLIGPAEWDAPDMVAFLKSVVEKGQARLAAPENKEKSP
ncbi:TlpA family protein disulfide reductase [Ensifer sp. MJa1]|uniref:TlpA family protein disulfide reductase n=1 Tax=Ensifer sp. MJa1 TaxID=2919888 RepID=UPI0030099375